MTQDNDSIVSTCGFIDPRVGREDTSGRLASDDAITPGNDALNASWTLEFPYTRTYGPVVGRFIAGLAQHRILGLRASDGVVFVPPTGYDPRDSSALSEWVEVGPEGTVEAVTWVQEPAAGDPLGVSFGWAEVRFEGCATTLLHLVVADEPPRIGASVAPVWADAPNGTIRDLAWFQSADRATNDGGVEA